MAGGSPSALRPCEFTLLKNAHCCAATNERALRVCELTVRASRCIRNGWHERTLQAYMEKQFTLTAGKKDDGTRLDMFVAESLKELSRSKAKRLVDEGLITVNAAQTKAHHEVRAGDVVNITIPPPEEPSVAPEEIPLSVIYEDEKIVVIDKQPGMVVHPAPGNLSHTLANALLGRYRRLSTGTHPLRPGIVHRLDKDTSGCLVVAKDDVTHRKLADLFAGRSVLKEYRALVAGDVPNDDGEIITLIDRSRRDRKKMAVTADKGREAVTRYEVVERYGHATHVSAFPKTGRTHQIRVHMAHIGHPILGDRQYGHGKTERKLGLEVPRQMLHAHRISFDHPETGENIEFEAPLPDDFLDVISRLKKLGNK